MKLFASRKFLLCFFALLTVGVAGGLVAGQIAKSNHSDSSAAPGDISIVAAVTAYDACPNIPGDQPYVPSGMLTDTEGNCYTPIPDPVDLCKNLPGIQVYVPDEHYRTPEGDCLPDPVDVCPNLEGDQETVPDDYLIDPDTNDCIPIEPPEPDDEDVCTNIPGIQTSTPSGMVNDNGRCYTPTTPPPNNSGQGQQPPLKNVPDFLQPLVQFFASLIPGPVADFFRELPEEVVYQLPIFPLVLAFIFILIPLLQSIREYIYKRRLIAFYDRERSIAEEKDNFITIASHYLRTPITIMKETIPLLLGSGEINPINAHEMNDTLQTLERQISTGLDAVNAAPALQDTIDPSIAKPKPVWRSGFFWLPVILSIVLTLLANFFIGVIGEKEISTNTAILEAVIVLGSILVLYVIGRNYHMQKRIREEKNALIAREQTIDAIRNDFLDQQAANIDAALSQLFFTSVSTPPSRPYSLYTDGISRLSNIHNKFILLSQIKTGINRNATTFDLSSAIDRAIASQQDDITKKRLNVRTLVGPTSITQNEPLFAFVISSVLENAIKFASPGGQVLIYSQPDDHMLHIRVSDNGRGIDPDKLNQLFKPFSRAESAVDFSYEGLGLSLFLDRLILTYTGGQIVAAPRAAGGTNVTITTPTDITSLDLQDKKHRDKKTRFTSRRAPLQSTSRAA